MSLATATTTTRTSQSMCNRSTLSNTHYLPSGYLSFDRDITSSSGTTTASWTTELPRELDASQQVSRLHAHLYTLLLHACVVDALQNSLHVALQLSPLRHQPPPAMYLRDRRLIFETTHQLIRCRTVGVIRLEDGEVGGVVARTLLFVGAGFDVQRLSVQVGVVLDNGEDERVVGHYDLYVVGLLGPALEVCDREVNSSRSLVPYEPNRHNVRPVRGWGVVGRGGSDDVPELPGRTVVHGGAISVAERGCLFADRDGEAEAGVGDGPVGKIAHISAGTDGSVTLNVVEVEMGGRGPSGGDGGLGVASANNVRGVIFVSVDVDGATGRPGRGISFGGYEERSYCLISSSSGGGMMDTRFRIDSSQHRSAIVRSGGGVRSNISLVSSNVSFLSLANLCSVSISCCLRERHNAPDDGRPVGVVPDLRCRRLIEAKRAASALYWTSRWCGRCIRHIDEVD